MSRFIDKLSQVSLAVSQPMGFRAAQSVAQKSKTLLIASIAKANIENLADYVAGADAVLFDISKLSSGAQTFQKISQVLPDIPLGGWLRDTGGRGIKQLVGAGFDFVVFSAASASLAVLQNDDLGRILQVEASLPEGLLKAVDELPVDAVFVAGEQEEGYSLTWHHLMVLQRFSALFTKSLLVAVPSNVTADELLALWEVGVDGVVVGTGKAGGLKKLRQIIDKLSFPQRKHGKREALLPPVSGETNIAVEEEDEEEEEE